MKLTGRGLWVVTALSVLAFVSMGQEGCETTTKDTADPDNGSDQKKRRKARLGDSITISTSNTKLKIAVKEVLDPVSAGEFDEPEEGTRFVGVRVSVRNVGDETYTDALSNGAQLIDNRDEQAGMAILTGGECASEFSSDLRLSPGSRQVGCIPFEMNDGARPKSFQFAGDSGFGPDNAEWRLK